jgi:C2 domain
MVLLHGVLDVTVHEAQHLPTTLKTQATSIVKRFLCCNYGPQVYGSLDPYTVMDVGQTRRLRTRFISGTSNPEWNERHEVYVADEAEDIRFEVKVGVHNNGTPSISCFFFVCDTRALQLVACGAHSGTGMNAHCAAWVEAAWPGHCNSASLPNLSNCSPCACWAAAPLSWPAP